MRGFWTAAGFCAHGLAGAGGLGQLVAEWIVEGTPSLDTWHMDSRRFGRAYRVAGYTLARTREVYETYYDVKYPGHERQAGRPLRLSPAYARLAELGAAFGEKSGWERANWFEPNAARGDESLRPRGWAGRLWSPAIGAEHLACRETAALFDETSFAKIEVSGEGAAAFLEQLCANRRRPRRRRDHLHPDAEPARRDRVRLHRHAARRGALPDRHRHGLRAARPGAGSASTRPRRSVDVDDVTSAYACFGLWGPKAREILQPLHDRPPLDFPYMRAARALRRRACPCLALRVTYVGELGWELYCPTEFGLGALGCDLGAGPRARPRRRRLQGDRLAAAREGLPRLGRRHHARRHPVRGRPRLRRQARQGAASSAARRCSSGEEPERRLSCLVLDDPRAVALGSEPVRAGGAPVGRVTSGGYGYSVERSIAYAYLPAALAAPGTGVEVEIFGEWVAGDGCRRAALRPGGRARSPMIDRS